MSPDSPLRRLTPLFAVVTLPLGVLTAILVGLPAAAAVFVVGWLLLTPASAILFGSPSSSQGDTEMQALIEAQIEAETNKTLQNATGDPVEKLRDRYARGEIDEVELERRLDALLEMEDIEDTTDSKRISRVIDGLDTDRTRAGRDTGSTAESGRREPEYNRGNER